VEALFFHTGSKVMGPPFTKAGRAGWPYLEIETFDLRSAKAIQDARDLMRVLEAEKDISTALDRSVFVGAKDERLERDIKWRAQYVGQAVEFWDLAKADLPWKMAEGTQLNMNGPSEGLRTTDLGEAAQSLTRHSFFKDACLARSPFRCFYRDDSTFIAEDLDLHLLEHLDLTGHRFSTDYVTCGWGRLPEFEFPQIFELSRRRPFRGQFCICNSTTVS
jgi:hypothetical protein